jgi:hypothetical protein
MTLDCTLFASDSAARLGWRWLPVYFWRTSMFVRHWHAILLALAVLCGLAGCGGNYKFNDNAYRPLGDAKAFNRGR